MVEMMEERASLKRSAPPVSLVECIICQESKKRCPVQCNSARLVFIEGII